MPLIHVLSPHIANQIAAGEVVERPASVVKELVENSIDAHARAVTVEIEKGGIELIRVTDNGDGIAHEDCRTAFFRHATSKITAAEDLTHIRSLGFRGEALASIASVACVTLKTRTQAEETGTKLCIENGEVLEETPIGWQKGTTMEVRGLFASVPARLKFLKSPRTEAGYIGDFLTRIILSHPDIAFHFVNDGRTVYQTFGDGDLKNALFAVYGAAILPHLCGVAYDDGYIRIEGYIGTAALSRPNRMQQSFFLNDRWIKSVALSMALQLAYDTRLMSNRFPFGVLKLKLASEEADVNVHPTKLEVRFADEHRVQRAVTVACTKALIQSDPVPQAEVQQHTAPGSTDTAVFTLRPPAVDLRQPVAKEAVLVAESSSHAAKRSGLYAADIPRFTVERDIPRTMKPVLRRENTSAPLFSEQREIIGVLFHTYWVVQQGNDVLLIDQHAAHERRLYERILSREIPIQSQKLLIPRVIALQPLDWDTFLTFRAELSQIGYETQIRGEQSVELCAVPLIDGVELEDRYFYDALESLRSVGEASAAELRRDALIQTSCKHAVKAGERISEQEIDALLRAYREDGIPMTCPHGRPVMVRLTKTEIEKLFKRIL